MKDGLYARVDDQARIVMVSIVGDVHDMTALEDLPKIWRAHPQIADYDSLLDLTRDAGRISWNAMRKIAQQWEAFSVRRDHGCRTAVVIRNDQWEAYARVLASIFPNRIFKTHRTIADARRWLDNGGNPRVRMTA